jgi:hypothetical protein
MSMQRAARESGASYGAVWQHVEHCCPPNIRTRAKTKCTVCRTPGVVEQLEAHLMRGASVRQFPTNKVCYETLARHTRRCIAPEKRAEMLAAQHNRLRGCTICKDPARAKVVLARLALGDGPLRAARRTGFGKTLVVTHTRKCLDARTREVISAKCRTNIAKKKSEALKLFHLLRSLGKTRAELTREATELVELLDAGFERKEIVNDVLPGRGLTNPFSGEPTPFGAEVLREFERLCVRRETLKAMKAAVLA